MVDLGIRWDDIRRIQHNGVGIIAIFGDDKRLVISGQNMDKNQDRLSAKIAVHAEKLGVEIEQTRRIPMTQKKFV
jgi:hypothetical protein